MGRRDNLKTLFSSKFSSNFSKCAVAAQYRAEETFSVDYFAGFFLKLPKTFVQEP